MFHSSAAHPEVNYSGDIDENIAINKKNNFRC